MTDESGTGSREKRSLGPGEGPQTLSQLQATGAEVVGSDGQKVGELKEVSDADFLAERTLGRDIRVPVSRVREVTADNKIVLDVSAEEGKNLGRDEPVGKADPGADFGESAKQEKGAWGIKKENN